MDEVSPYSRSALDSSSRISATVTICIDCSPGNDWRLSDRSRLYCIVIFRGERGKRPCYTPLYEKTCAQNHATTQQPVCQDGRKTGRARVTCQSTGNRYQTNRSCDNWRSELSV